MASTDLSIFIVAHFSVLYGSVSGECSSKNSSHRSGCWLVRDMFIIRLKTAGTCENRSACFIPFYGGRCKFEEASTCSPLLIFII